MPAATCPSLAWGHSPTQPLLGMQQDGMLGQHLQGLDPVSELAGKHWVPLKHRRILQTLTGLLLPSVSPQCLRFCPEGLLQAHKAVPILSLCLLQAAQSAEKRGGKMSRSGSFFAGRSKVLVFSRYL